MTKERKEVVINSKVPPGTHRYLKQQALDRGLNLAQTVAALLSELAQGGAIKQAPEPVPADVDEMTEEEFGVIPTPEAYSSVYPKKGPAIRKHYEEMGIPVEVVEDYQGMPAPEPHTLDLSQLKKLKQARRSETIDE